MLEPIHALDPNGDILLVVRHFSWMPDPSNRDLQDEQVHLANQVSKATRLPSDLSDRVNEPDDADLRIVHYPQSPADSGDIAVEYPSTPTDAEPGTVARFQVSSRHLALASAVFNLKAFCSLEQCLTEVPLDNDDPNALLVLLRLVHGQFQQVPRKVNLWTLTQIAILVDKYELLEITQLSIDNWLSGVEDTIPSDLNEDLLPWLLITKVFRREDMFLELGQVAAFGSKGPLEAPGLPIQGQILSMALKICQAMVDFKADEIESSRKNALSEIFAYLDQRQEQLRCQKNCSEGIECDGMTLGCLLKGLQGLGIFPTPQPPYKDISVKGVLEGLKAMELPQYCKSRGSKGKKSCEGLKCPLRAKIDELENQFGVGKLRRPDNEF